MARPKGYAAWKPANATVDVLDNVKDVLREYQAHLPLTVRQIFYRLVGQYGFEKTELAYNRLCEYLVRARRAGMIDFDDIRDDGTIIWHVLSLSCGDWGRAGAGFAGEAGFARDVRNLARNYRRDRLSEQPIALELWCEAAGMVPQLALVAHPFSVPVYSTGGFSSVTVTYEIAQRALRRDKPTVFLHVGDYDPSGESIFEAMTVDAMSFLRADLYERTENGDHLYLAKPVLEEGLPDLRPLRVALTAEQVDEYDLPTAPPKASDTRSRNWMGETCQLEAMPPDELADLVRRAIEGELDMALYEEAIATETVERERIITRVTEALS